MFVAWFNSNKMKLLLFYLLLLAICAIVIFPGVSVQYYISKLLVTGPKEAWALLFANLIYDPAIFFQSSGVFALVVSPFMALGIFRARSEVRAFFASTALAVSAASLYDIVIISYYSGGHNYYLYAEHALYNTVGLSIASLLSISVYSRIFLPRLDKALSRISFVKSNHIIILWAAIAFTFTYFIFHLPIKDYVHLELSKFNDMDFVFNSAKIPNTDNFLIPFDASRFEIALDEEVIIDFFSHNKPSDIEPTLKIHVYAMDSNEPIEFIQNTVSNEDSEKAFCNVAKAHGDYLEILSNDIQLDLKTMNANAQIFGDQSKTNNLEIFVKLEPNQGTRVIQNYTCPGDPFGCSAARDHSSIIFSQPVLNSVFMYSQNCFTIKIIPGLPTIKDQGLPRLPLAAYYEEKEKTLMISPQISDSLADVEGQIILVVISAPFPISIIKSSSSQFSFLDSHLKKERLTGSRIKVDSILFQRSEGKITVGNRKVDITNSDTLQVLPSSVALLTFDKGRIELSSHGRFNTLNGNILNESIWESMPPGVHEAVLIGIFTFFGVVLFRLKS
jgi:hypothetical protein